MNFRTWCRHYFPGGSFSQDGTHYSCRNHYRDDKNASLSFSDLDGGKWHDFGISEGGQVKFFCHEHGIPEVWDGADPWQENQPSRQEPPKRQDKKPTADDIERSEKARLLWEKSAPTDTHAYLEKKKISIKT